MSFGNNILFDLKFLFRCILNPLKKKCLYVGHIGYKNLGDEILRDAIINIFYSYLLIVPQKGLLVRIFEKLGLIKFDVLLLGGGTLLLRSEGVLKRISAQGYNKKLVFGTGVANQIFWKDIPDNYGDFSQWIECLNKMDYVSVRGPMSRNILEKLGLKNKVEVIGDPALYFLREINLNKKQRNKRLGINVGTSKFGNKSDMLWGRNEEAFLRNFSTFLKMMVQDGWSIEILPVCKEDLEAIKKVIFLSGFKDSITIFKNFFSVRDAIKRLESYDVFVGQKLHAVVLSYCANTPAIMIEYRPKCRDFMESIKMERFNIRTDEFEPLKVKNMTNSLYDNLEAVRLEAHNNCLYLKNTLLDAAKRASTIIK